MATIEEAKLRYPVGTMFSNKNLGYNCENVKVTGVYYKKNYDDSISLETGNADRAGSFTVYQDEKWAKITHYAIPEKWCVKITTENSKTLDAWRKKQSNFYPTVDGLMGWLISDKGDGTYTNWDSKIPSGYTEIRIEDFIKYIYKEEESLIGRYAKLIIKGNNNEGKYYLITSNTRATRLFDNVKECSFYNNSNWEIMPKDFVYTGQDTIPKYVKCIKSWHVVWTTDKIYKTEDEQLDYPHTLSLKNNIGEIIKCYNWRASHQRTGDGFEPCTEEEYLAQQSPKKEQPMKEDLTGRWLKCIKKNNWSYDGKKPEVGEYVQVKRGTMNSTYLDVINKTGKEESFTLTRLTKLEEFTLMPIGFSPDVKKEECSKEHMPKYVEWIDDLGSNMSGKMCNSSNFKKGKIFNTKTDNIPESGVSGKDDWKTTWKWYYYNFKPSTREAYNSQNNIIEIIPGYKDVNLPYSAGFTYNTYPSKAVQNSDGNWYSQPVYSRELSYAIGHDPYKKEEKKNKIKEVKLPEVKKRLIF